MQLPEVARQWNVPGWTALEVEAYLRRFQYRFGPEELKGLERYDALLQEHGFVESD